MRRGDIFASADWAAVAKFSTEHMLALGLTQEQFAKRANVSLSIAREVLGNTKQRSRHPRTLEAMSEALEQPRDTLRKVALRQPLPSPTDQADHDAQQDRLAAIEDRLNAIDTKLTQLGSIDAKLTQLSTIHAMLTKVVDGYWPDPNPPTTRRPRQR